MARDFLSIELTLDYDLSGNPGVISPGDKYGVMAEHAMVADQTIHDGLVESMTHVEGTRHIRWGKLNGVGDTGSGAALCVLASGKITPFFPFLIPARLKRRRFETF